MTAPLPPDFIAEIEKTLPAPTVPVLLTALDATPPVSVRLNSRKPCDAPPFGSESPVAWCAEQGRYLDSRPLFTLMPEMHGGAFYVQEAASMIHQLLVSRICAGSPPRVLDICAAPGGKTTAMLNALPDGSLVVANEQSPQRAAVLRENLVKYGYPGVAVTCGDAREFGAMEGMFDILAVDAPCSGEGMMRKEEVARTQWTPGLVESCARLQGEILDGALPALRPGGWLLYSTCTLNTRENEEMARRLIDDHGLLPVTLLTPGEMQAFGITPGLTLPDGTPGHGMRFIPGVSRSEGLYVAVFRKPGDTDGQEAAVFHRAPAIPAKRRKKEDVKVPDISPCREWLVRGEEYDWEYAEGSVSALPQGLKAIVGALPPQVRLLSAGIETATLKGKDLIPAPPLALSTALAPGKFEEVELDRETALQYLRRESLTLPPGTPRGMVLVKHNGIPLGWVKNLGNRANNLWPAPWRIKLRQLP